MTTLDLGIFDAGLFDAIQGDVAGIIEDELVDLGVIVEADSPTGVSSGPDSLKGSWDINVDQSSSDGLLTTLENPLPFAFERLAGRPPGKQPPVSKLERWARSKGISPYAVARSIGQRGTQRYQEGPSSNVLLANPVSKEIPTARGPQVLTTANMVSRINSLRY